MIGLRITTLAATLGLILPATPALAQESKDPRTEVLELLADLKQGTSCGQWQQYGDTAENVLAERLTSADSSATIRVRAAHGLGCFKTKGAGAVLEKVATDKEQPAMIRRHTMVALARSAPAKALPVIREFLTSPYPTERIAAAEAAQAAGTMEARNLINAHLKQEKDPLVRRQMEQALTKKSGE